MKKIYIIIVILLHFNFCFSQLENDNWHFGNNNAIQINNQTTIINTSQIESTESTGSVSDSSGNLLFYTNGSTVWNSQNEIMLNGNGLLGNASASQLVIVPHPGNNNLYYIITSKPAKDENYSSLYHYSIVDMTGDSGLGEVITLNQNLFTQSGNILGSGFQSAEAITVASNNVNNEYLVLIPNRSFLYTYKIDVNGINPIAFTQNSLENSFAAGTIKASPNGDKIALCSFQNYIQLYPYNSNTAVLGSLSYSYNAFASGKYPFMTEFSPDGNLLYVTTITYDSSPYQLLAINPSSNLVSNLLPPTGTALRAGIQRHPNAGILLTATDRILSIKDPNSFASCEIVNTNYILTGTSNTYIVGLPQLIPENLSLNCIDNLNLITDVNSPNNDLKQASNTITASNEIQSGARAVYHAGSMVVLSEGFHSDSGSIFRGYIEDCSNAYEGKNSNNDSIKEIDKLVLNENNEFTIFPNPVNNGVFYVNTDANAERTVTVFDVLGKQVLKTTTSNSAINVSNLTAGVYLVQVVEEGKTATKKLVIR